LKKHIAILGSTGSIGKQSLEVISRHTEEFEIEVLTAQNNADLLIEQAVKYRPNAVVIGNDKFYDKVSKALFHKFGVKVYAGVDAISQIVEMDSIDKVLIAIVGFAGLCPVINAVKSGKEIALANKESLVVAGELITGLAKEKGVNIYPIDSEHSAIFQCLAGEFDNAVEKIYLTGSGGPFRGKTREFLCKVKKEQALKHPNWSMGDKITIDSATMINKGFEVIEAKWLFGLKHNQIDVVIHPQSVVHSIVQFQDGSMKAQMGLPDMRIPIQYALSYPKRLKSDYPRFDFLDYPNLTFEMPDTKSFPSLDLAFESLNKGGNMPCIMNAANEIVVGAFLKDKIGFLEMSDIIEKCMHTVSFIAKPTYNDYILTDKETRNIAVSYIQVKKREE